MQREWKEVVDVISVYTPVGKVVKQEFDLARRPGSLDGLVLGLLDNNKWNAQRLLRQLEVELGTRHKLKEVFTLRKPYFSRPAAPDMIEQIANRADVVVTALAD